MAPPFTTAARAPADEISIYLDRAHRRYRRRLEAVEADRTTTAEHEVRKAGKRVRYLAELAEPVLGQHARRLVTEFTGVQDRLGEQQDRAMLHAFLAETLDQGHGEPSWTPTVQGLLELVDLPPHASL
jgi:CHAD domain-containing protein